MKLVQHSIPFAAMHSSLSLRVFGQAQHALHLGLPWASSSGVFAYSIFSPCVPAAALGLIFVSAAAEELVPPIMII